MLGKPSKEKILSVIECSIYKELVVDSLREYFPKGWRIDNINAYLVGLFEGEPNFIISDDLGSVKYIGREEIEIVEIGKSDSFSNQINNYGMVLDSNLPETKIILKLNPGKSVDDLKELFYLKDASMKVEKYPRNVFPKETLIKLDKKF